MEAGAHTGYSGTGNTYRQAAVCQLRKAIRQKNPTKKTQKDKMKTSEILTSDNVSQRQQVPECKRGARSFSQHTPRSRSSPSPALALTAGRSYHGSVSRGALFSRHFTSVNMCGNPRAHVLRASHWPPSRRRARAIGRALQPVVA